MTELLDRDTGPDGGGQARAADAFRVLGLPLVPDLSDAVVRRAYLARLRAVHPDGGGDTGAAQAVTAAYEALRAEVAAGGAAGGGDDGARRPWPGRGWGAGAAAGTAAAPSWRGGCPGAG